MLKDRCRGEPRVSPLKVRVTSRAHRVIKIRKSSYSGIARFRLFLSKSEEIILQIALKTLGNHLIVEQEVPRLSRGVSLWSI